MRYGSICSGIEAATVALEPLGWEPAFFAENARFPCAVLKHHYPNVPNRGDITKFKGWPDESIDVLFGGTPCQSFSLAGFRKGMDDPRGNLSLTFLAIASRTRARWLVWENVPSVLWTNEGKDFEAFIGGLQECGYGFAWRVLDAQYFGVPQQRRRIFLVGYSGDWRCAAAVLFERNCLSRNSAPCREEGAGVARSLTTRSGGESGKEQQETFIDNHGTPLNPILAFSAKDYGLDVGEVSPALRAMNNVNSKANGGGQVAVNIGDEVRRLMPVECERLMGLPDDYTLVPYLKRMASDSARYKAIGNSFPVPIIKWIGERIDMVEGIRNGA